MRKTLVIAARDYRAAVRTKSFVISLLILPLMMGGSIAVQALLKDKVDVSDKKFAIIDRTGGQLFDKLAKEADKRNNPDSKEMLDDNGRAKRVKDWLRNNPDSRQIFDDSGRQTKPRFILEKAELKNDTPEALDQLRFDLSERVRKQQIFGFLEIGPDVMKFKLPDVKAKGAQPAPAREDDRRILRYQSNSPTFDAFQNWAQKTLTEVIEEQRFAALNTNLNRQELRAILQPLPLVAKGLSSRDTQGKIEEAKDESPVVSFGVPAGMIFLMFMLVLVGATPLMQGVIEEKMQRIAEVLLGSVRPFELMMGKLLGMVGVSLTLAAVYLGGAYWAAYRYDFAQYIPTGLLIWFLVYQVLAVLMFGSLFIAIGAACSDMRETQAMTWPVMLLICVPMFVWVNVIREPNSPFATWVSLFPFATPMLMLGRQAVPPGIPLWQPFLGVGLVLLMTTLCVYAASRIFRVGILMQGKGANLGQVVRWVFRG